ncbi:MAG: radical SAM protein [Thermoplasmata archaeon]|nr:MAG: radical SAM protein [Thermoplasmata archaeon]
MKRTKALEKSTFEGNLRRYYRFRPAKWYGGIVTGDVCACNLLCYFCWAGDEIRNHPERVGKLYSPDQVFNKFEAISRKCGYTLMRLSGQEPTIGREHLLELLSLLARTKYRFILETNGILIGAEQDYAQALSKFGNLHVRVSVKGTCEEEFSHLTDAAPEFFQLQLDAIKNLIDAGVSVHPAVMVSFSTKDNLKSFIRRLEKIDATLPTQMEVEELILYPHVVKRLKKHNFDIKGGHEPDKVPKEQI